MKILHLSDLHFTEFMKPREYEWLASAAKGMDLVVITGDITNNGSPREYEVARKALEPLAEEGNLVIMPGNHDYGAVGNLFDPTAADRFDDLAREVMGFSGYKERRIYQRVVRNQQLDESVRIIGLNSCLMTLSPTDMARGEIGRAQMDELDEALTEARLHGSGPIVVALHHHPFLHDDKAMRLEDSSAFVQTIAGRCDVLLCGHHHHADMWTGRLGIPLILAADNSPHSGRAWVVEDLGVHPALDVDSWVGSVRL